MPLDYLSGTLPAIRIIPLGYGSRACAKEAFQAGNFTLKGNDLISHLQASLSLLAGVYAFHVAVLRDSLSNRKILV